MSETIQHQLRDGLVISPCGFSDLAATVALMAEAADALDALEAERDRLCNLVEAAFKEGRGLKISDGILWDKDTDGLAKADWTWSKARAALKETDT